MNEEETLRPLSHIRDIAIDERRVFERDFLGRYHTLAALSRELSMPVRVSFTLDREKNPSSMDEETLAQLAINSSAAETGRLAGGIAGGAAAGAAIGSFVPGIGTVIGAGVGSLVGYLGWSYSSTNPQQVDRFREEARANVWHAAASHFSTLRFVIMRSFGTYANQAWRALDRLMDDYLVSYGRTIESLREHDLAEQNRLMEELELIRTNEDLIKHRVELLHATLSRFRELT